MCFIDPAFVDHLHHGCRRFSNKHSDMHPIVQRPQKSKLEHLLAQMDPWDYLLYDAYTDHITASESFSITNGYMRTHSTFIIHLAADSEHWNWNEKCLGATAFSNSEITFPKLFETCVNTTWYHKLWRNCFWMFALCRYCAQNRPDSWIPGFQKKDFEMYQFGYCWFSNVSFWRWIKV